MLDTSRWKRLGIRLLLIALVLAAVVYAFLAFVNIRTNVLWFDSVHAGSVYGTILGAQILLFAVFGGLTALAVAASLLVVVRNRPRFRPDPVRQKWRARFVRYESRVRVWLIVVVSLWLGVRAGSRATHRWQTYLMWRHSVSWGQQDPQFHRDLSYFVSIYPFHKMVDSYLSSIVVTCLVVTVIASYLYGALRIRGRGRRMTPSFKAQVSLLLGLYLLLKAASYWLGRFALSTSTRGPVTGLSYTDQHAVLPARTILMVVAVLCALVLFANVRLRRLRYAVLGLVTMAVAAILIGGLWPTLVMRYREQPSASTLDRTSIERNQAATLNAFGLDHQVATQQYGVTRQARPSGAALLAEARQIAQIRLLDPNQLSPTFNVKQQVQAYYNFKSTLDIDHYPLAGQEHDLAVAVRELNLSGISRSTWTNRHLVYTHGYGVVAAPTDRMDPRTGTPLFVNGGLPPANRIPVTTPQIYFGQNSPSYSIVGQPAGSTTDLEFDYPGSNSASGAVHTTYAGGGGVPIGSRFDRFLYAVKLGDPNIFFSSEINSGSKLLTVRNPRSRVATVAPWLTLDGDVYPAMVDGHVDWVVDGYTSTSNYPESQKTNLRSATSNSLTKTGSTVTQPNTTVNYLHNSVKATVDAYTGKVTLYSWNQAAEPDPILQTWEAAFPGLVQPESTIPADLLPHLRYPQDLFNVQRSLLTNYHVTNPRDFYSGSAFWKIPSDPTLAATARVNRNGITSTSSSPTLPSVYMSMSATGDGPAGYALSTPMVTLNDRDLAGFLTVNAEPGPGYGRFTLLEFPAGQSVGSPSQIQNDIESDNTIAKALTLQRQGNSKVVLGNLLTIPLAGQVLYVEPVYAQAVGGNSFPILRHVIAVYGNGQPAFKSTLDDALRQAIANFESRAH
ncbi:UPF0182 family protein [Nocardioides cynanchi]|uniref:UPF0182 family membrane protein n=1 Tax=Nocardioides cynanchi TaxID=2558918 RepID=UPI001248D913|nr:UPF0182 family protein [Nocardioides cynanchi]